MTSTDELERLMREAGKQSPLPWHTDGASLFDSETYKLSDYLDPSEAALIVAAVNALPELVALRKEVGRLRAELEAARVLAWLQEDGQ